MINLKNIKVPSIQSLTESTQKFIEGFQNYGFYDLVILRILPNCPNLV